MKNQLVSQIQSALGVDILEHRSLPVGFGLVGMRISLADGREAAVKASRTGQDEHLSCEAFMLQELRDKSNLPVPEVYFSGHGLLVMEWLTSGSSINVQVQRHAAELLVDLHSRPFETFGYAQDTLIGPLRQPNPASDKWVPFFRDQRLLFMANEALKEKRLPGRMFERLEKLAGQLDQHLGEPKHPALLHGDLWGGNVIAHNNRISGFIDPAIYCGHPEIELAFTTMFSTFGQAFFETYQSLSQLDPGFFEERLNIYNLYPTLVHVRLFGDSYLPSLDLALRKIGL